MNDTIYKAISENVAHPCFFTVQRFLIKEKLTRVSTCAFIPKFKPKVDFSIIEIVNNLKKPN
jgi:hypothetical protein